MQDRLQDESVGIAVQGGGTMKFKLGISLRILSLVIGVICLFSGVYLFASEEHGRDLESIIANILQSTQSEALADVAVEALSPGLLEELGDSVMGLLFDEWHHERMDIMLGGDGSDQLAQYHRELGAQYLAANGDIDAMRFVGGNWMRSGSMMGFPVWGSFGGRWNALRGGRNSAFWFWALPVFLGFIMLVLGVFLFTGSKRKPGGSSKIRAVTIVETRFAQGDLTEKEFLHMKEILKQ